jgi:HD-GYP domain-containing protein (c-di-GMP phosphodiesterase class II)/DNA-binding CsgD family transcriptional regulator
MASGPLRLAELLVGLSGIADVGMGMEQGEAARAALLGVRLAEALGVRERSDVYYVTLLQHIGCTAYAHEAAALLGGDELAVKAAAIRTDFSSASDVLLGYLPRLAPGSGGLTRLRVAVTAATRARPIVAGYSRANCEVAARTAARVGLGPGIERGLLDIYEQWDGKGGPRRIRGDAIAETARIAQVACMAALFDRVGGVTAAASAVSRRAGRALDPSVAAAFCAGAGAMLGELSGTDVLPAAVAAEPGPVVMVSGAELDGVCRAFGDAVDLKSPWLHGHSAAVGELAGAAAAAAGLGSAQAAALRRAGYLHDIGRAAVPNQVWAKPAALTSSETERVRLHAYYGERIIGRCPPLAPVAALAGLHHERLDGSGYHRQSRAPELPPAARILAAADAYQAMTQHRPHRAALAADAAAAQLRAEARAGHLDADAARAVLTAAGQPGGVRRAWPAGLTERQVEVLRLVAGGLSNPQIAAALVVSRRTAEHHVQDVYAKIGVSSRASAALFAMEHGILP